MAPVVSFIRAPFWFFTFYALIYTVYNILVTILSLRTLFRSCDVIPLPLHPDRCGGLAAISRYATVIGLGMGAVGLYISASVVYEVRNGTLEQALPVLLTIIPYLVCAPILFFWPLGTAHEAMQNAKDEELLSIAHQFREQYRSLREDMEDEKQEFSETLKHLENVQKLYALADSFPVWPYDTRSLRRFLAIITVPLVPAITAVLSAVFVELFT